MKKQGFMTTGEIAMLVGVVIALAVWLLFPRGTGSRVIVTRSGEEAGRYDLETPAQMTVLGANDFSLTLVIEDGQAHVEDSTCPDLICQHHAPISHDGEAIICLPGQVVISVEGGRRHGADAVSG